MKSIFIQPIIRSCFSAKVLFTSSIEIIPKSDQWLKFILAQNNNDNFCQRLRGEIISQLKACTNLDEVEKLDCHPVVAKVEALTLIWLLTIKTREGVFGDVLEVLLLFVSYAQRSTLDKIMFSKFCLQLRCLD